MTDFKILDHNAESGQYMYARYEDNILKEEGWVSSRPDFAKSGDEKDRWDDAIIAYQEEYPDAFPKSKAARNIEKLEVWLAEPIEWKKAETEQDSCEEAEKGEIDQPKEKVKKEMAEMKSEIVSTAKAQLDPKNILKLLMTPLIETAKPVILKIDREYAITHEKTERIHNKEIREENKKNDNSEVGQELNGEADSSTETDMSEEDKDNIGTVMTSKFMNRMTDVMALKDQLSEDNVKSTIEQGKKLAESKYMETKDKKKIATIIISLVTLLAALAAGMLLGRKADEREKELEEESLAALRPNQEKIDEKTESESDGNTVMRKAKANEENLSLDKNDEDAEEYKNSDFLTEDNCKIALCIPDRSTDIMNVYEKSAPEGIIIEIDHKMKGAFSVGIGQKVKAGDTIGNIGGVPIRAQADFTVTGKKENYITGRYGI